MEINKGGRKRLGANKRVYDVKLRFNEEEMKVLKKIVESYNLDITKRGVLSPFLRRLILSENASQEDQIPDSLSKLTYQINRIGTNINQLTKVANYKNMRSPSAKLETEIRKSNELMEQIFDLMNTKFN